ncbi:MAG: serine hydrolase [Pseudomonadota bacterium]
MPAMSRRFRRGLGAPLFSLCALGFWLCNPGVFGQSAPSSYGLPGGAAPFDDPFIAAGFRALFTCSAHFAMDRPLADIERVELADTAALGLPNPEIDAERRLVRAADANGRVRVAVFRDSMGCTLLPPELGEADAAQLPYLARARGSNPAAVAFPRGDRVALTATAAQSAVLARAFDGASYGEGSLTVATLVVQGGSLVAERYRDGFGVDKGYRTWSTAKSITATLVGMAVKDGLLDLHAPVPVRAWQQPADRRQTIRLKHLLWMSSGLWSRGSNTSAMYFGGQDVISSATTTPLEADPGTRWKYANNDTLLALVALKTALADEQAYLRFPYERLFEPLGMHHTWMEIDHQGNFIGSSQVYTTARDLARFGLLYLNDGNWFGEQLLPEDWTAFVSTPAPTRPVTAGQQGYGAQFWLFDPADDLPSNAYFTAGNKGQFVVIVPEHDLVIVRTGVDPLGKRFALPAFVRDVISAFST